jgi:hypothetical protein
LNCPYLQDARIHDKPVPISADQVPHKDIRVSEEFLAGNEELLIFLSGTLANAALNTDGAVDPDVREALESLIRSYRTLESGLYYESLPNNPLAANIYRTVQAAVAEFRQEEPKRLGMSKTRDADVLGVLVFLSRFELDQNNGRRKSRAFIDVMLKLYPQASASTSTATLSSPLLLR